MCLARLVGPVFFLHLTVSGWVSDRWAAQLLELGLLAVVAAVGAKARVWRALTDPLIPVVRRSLRRAFIVAAVWCAATAVGLVLFLSTPDRAAGLAIDAVTGRLPPPDPTSEVVSEVMFWVCRAASLAYLGVESIGVIGDRRRHRAEPVQGLKTKYPST